MVNSSKNKTKCEHLRDFSKDATKEKGNYQRKRPEIIVLIEELEGIKNASVSVVAGIDGKIRLGQDITSITNTLISNFDDFRKKVSEQLYQKVQEVNNETSTDTVEELSDQWAQAFLGKYFEIILHVGSAENIFTTLSSVVSPLKYMIHYRDTLYLISESIKMHYLTRSDACPDERIKTQIMNLSNYINSIVDNYSQSNDIGTKRARIILHHPKLKESIQEIYIQTLMRCGHV